MIDRIVELLEEYRDCHKELDVFKLAAQIREAVHKDDLGLERPIHDNPDDSN